MFWSSRSIVLFSVMIGRLDDLSSRRSCSLSVERRDRVLGQRSRGSRAPARRARSARRRQHVARVGRLREASSSALSRSLGHDQHVLCQPRACLELLDHADLVLGSARARTTCGRPAPDRVLGSCAATARSAAPPCAPSWAAWSVARAAAARRRRRRPRTGGASSSPDAPGRCPSGL